MAQTGGALPASSLIATPCTLIALSTKTIEEKSCAKLHEKSWTGVEPNSKNERTNESSRVFPIASSVLPAQGPVCFASLGAWPLWNVLKLLFVHLSG